MPYMPDAYFYPEKHTPKERIFFDACDTILFTPLFRTMLGEFHVYEHPSISSRGACIVNEKGNVYAKVSCALSSSQWLYCLIHSLLHLAFGHFDRDNMPIENGDFNQALWNKACDIYIARFLADIGVGEPICPDPAEKYRIKLNDERKIYAHLKYLGEDGTENIYSTNGGKPDMVGLNHPLVY